MKKPHRNYCPVAAMLNLVGDRWNWLIIREAFYGATRFSQFEHNTGIAKNLLSVRLRFLVEEGIFRKDDIGESGTRHAYSLTEKGQSLQTVLIAMYQWGSEHLYEDDLIPVRILERASQQPPRKLALQSQSGQPLNMSDLAILPGPSATEATRKRLAKIPFNQSDNPTTP